MDNTIPSIINNLQTELLVKVDEIVELTEAKDGLEADLEVLNRDVRRIRTALQALTGGTPAEADLPTPPTKVEANPPVPDPRPPVQHNVGPKCKSCDGTVVFTARTLQSGRIVNMWICNDCRNEQF